MKFVFNQLSRGFLYTLGKFLAILGILILLGFAFARFPKATPQINFPTIGGIYGEK